MATQEPLKENITYEKQTLPTDWLIYLKNPVDLWAEHWFALLLEIVSVLLFLICCRHARKRGDRALCFLMACFFGCFGAEMIQQIPHPGYQLWWYHQGTANFLQHRLPLYVVCSVAVLYYFVDFIMRKMQFPYLTQSFINALVSIAAAFPCLCLAPNLLLIIVHFDDPIFQDRLLNVPYAQMTYLFLVFFHSGHLFNKNFDAIEEQDRHFYGFARCSLESGLFSSLYAIVEVYLLHMFVKNLIFLPIPLITPLALLILFYLSRQEMQDSRIENIDLTEWRKTFRSKELLIISAFFVVILSIAAFVQPENLKSNSERVEWGPCDVFQSVSNTSPIEFQRRRYVCPNATTNGNFGFHCLPASQVISSEVREEYTLCGTAFDSDLPRILSWYSLAVWPIFYLLLSVTVNSSSGSEHFRNAKKID